MALNATIEAARAGDVGKGFAVVASEVKALARDAANATEEISRQLGEIQSAGERTATSVETINANINAINGRVIAIAGAVQEQQTTVLQIASSTSQTTSGVRDLKQAVDVIRKSAEANKERAERLVASAKGALV